MVLAALVVGGAVRAAWAQDYNRDIRNAENQMQRRQHSQALKMLDGMLAKYKEPGQVKEIQEHRIDCLMALKQFGDVLAEVAKLQKDFAQDKDLQSRAQLFIGDALRGQEKFPEAVAAYRKLVKEHADYPDRAAEALLRAGEVYCSALNKPAEGIAVYMEVEKTFPDVLPRAAEAARRAAVAHETVTKDLVKAAAFYQSLAEKYAAVYDENTRAVYYTKAADCLTGAGKLPEAQAVAARAEKAMEATGRKTPFALRQADLLAAMKKMPETRAECERIICAYPLEPPVCQAAQRKVVDAYRAESKFAETLGAARTLYDAAGSEQDIRAAAQVVAQAFRSMDGNLGRANEFLAYQRFGPDGADGKPGTADDVKVNHLAGVKYAASSPAREKLFAAAVAAQPKTFEGYRAMAFLYVYWGKPKEAAQHFHLALRACTDAEVPQAASELVLIGMKAYRASFHGLDQVFEYISYGPKGKSGKENIPDPFQGL
ncbi:MAG: hypothetical protein AMJ81_09080 [Phycisphaerae bacterium SM23_33]|nr:MAG: hypothetical protein AMJ81_09080 [Phycisphaerae bacterium SM23_33]